VLDPATLSQVGGLNTPDHVIHGAITPDGTKLYAGARNAGGPIFVIDTATDTIITSIPVGYGCKGLAMNPAGTRLYCTAGGTDVIYIVDVATDTLLNTVTSGPDPGTSIALNPTGTRAYFHGNGAERVLDTSTNTVIDIIPVNLPS